MCSVCAYIYVCICECVSAWGVVFVHIYTRNACVLGTRLLAVLPETTGALWGDRAGHSDSDGPRDTPECV